MGLLHRCWYSYSRRTAGWLHEQSGASEATETLNPRTPAAAGANQVFKQKPWRSMAAAKHNKDRSGSESDARLARALKRDKVLSPFCVAVSTLG